MSALINKEAALKAWAGKAESDWKAMRGLAAMGKEAPADAVCFHAQQCIEKYLKAYLTSKEIEFGKTHDIEELAAKLPNTVAIPLTIDQQDMLTDYAVDSRYPEIEPSPTLDESIAAVNAAEAVRKVIRAALNL